VNTFRNRTDPAYRNRLEELLRLDGPNGLIDTALEMARPIKVGRRTYDRAIGIDFFGFGGTTLFDRGNVITPWCAFDRINELARRVPELNEKRIIVRFRILFVYPYSVAGQNRVHAETSSLRAAMDEPRYHRGHRLMEQLSEESLQRSSLVSTQHRTLGVLDDFRQTLGRHHPLFMHPNRFDVRFTLVNPFACGLRVNSRFFCDDYLLAKPSRFASRCADNIAPVVELDAQSADDNEAYRGYCDHFRFLLDHDATVDYADMVCNDNGVVRLRRPEEVSYVNTAKRVLTFANRGRDEKALRSYTVSARHKMLQLCPPVRQFRANEIIFIGCSWTGAPPQPIPEAQMLRALLQRDFDITTPAPRDPGIPVNVRLVTARPGQALSEAVYRALDETTCAVLILSPTRTESHSGRTIFSATPNVHHELGYLMAKLPRGRVFVFRHERVDAPSNVGDLVHMTYTDGKFELAYTEFLQSLSTVGIFSSKARYERIMRRHCDKLRTAVQSGAITPADYTWALNVARGGSSSAETHAADRSAIDEQHDQ
jgi:CAP12/Pycsar effector protein, TIR domain